MSTSPLDYLKGLAAKHEASIKALEGQLRGVERKLEAERAKLEAIQEAIQHLSTP